MYNSNISSIKNLDDTSTSNMNTSSRTTGFTSDPSAMITQISINSLTIFLAIAYTLIIISRPTIRKNKLNWFTINVCLTSALFSIITLIMNLQLLLAAYNDLSCRSLFYLVDMASCQLMYSHCVFAISRFLTIVYAHKHIFRSNVYLWSYIILGWVVSCLIALPHIFADILVCSISNAVDFLPYYTLITTIFLPIIIVTIFNARTLIYVRNSTRRVHAAGTAGQVSHKRDVFLVKLTVGTFIVFIVGWTPSFTILLFNQSDSIPTILNQCFQILGSFAVLFDVLLLIFTNQPVRAFLKQFITKIFRF